MLRRNSGPAALAVCTPIYAAFFSGFSGGPTSRTSLAAGFCIASASSTE